MRITNQMMINTTMADIQTNKNQLNTLDSQLSTEKKISKPSDDPIIAIRALRLRSSLNQVTQYLDKNIPDASAWLDTTEGALDEAYSILTDIYSYCNQAASDSYSSSERTTLVESLQNLKEAFYSEGDVDYAGRYCFTGYMTDTPLNFATEEDAADKDFIITQTFTTDDIDTKTAYKNFYETEDIVNMVYSVDSDGNVVQPESQDVYRIRLAYDELKDSISGYTNAKVGEPNGTAVANNAMKLTVTKTDGSTEEITVKLITDAQITDISGDTHNISTTLEQDNCIPGDDEIIYNPTSGELLIGKNQYSKLYSTDVASFSFTYEKDSFQKGDQNPIMYFDCVSLSTETDDAGNVTATNGIVYTKTSEDVEYNINFSQKLKVNTEASDAFSINVGRDIDDLVNAVKTVTDLETQIAKVESMMSESKYKDDETAQTKLAAIKENLTKQKTIAEENMTDAFEKGITKFQNYQQQVSLAKADVGNRKTRLNLTKSRLTEQKTNFTNLKSENEDIDLEEVVVGYSSAQLVYNASLTAASKVVQQTLLDFL